ncbi:MAG: S-methyl-5'-thioadenosine phosphorylase [Candidatus Margulisiibacteriota bacterium]|jgi:5'-methylthioadenosine phosphorylase
MVKIGIIGGSGVDDPKILKDFTKTKMHTPYGATSDLVVQGKLGNTEVVILPRHGENHRINPTMVNFRANVWIMKELGVTHLIGPTAVGSLREEIEPGHLVFPDQFIDRTTSRKTTFYEGHVVCHISMADPFCEDMRRILIDTAKKLNVKYHPKGTVVTIEGPRFSTRAESHMYRSWGCDIINMSTVTEATLAREAGICYAAIAMSTDYDCWKESEEAVSVEMVMATMKKNAESVKNILLEAVPKFTDKPCNCREAYKTSAM